MAGGSCKVLTSARGIFRKRRRDLTPCLRSARAASPRSRDSSSCFSSSSRSSAASPARAGCGVWCRGCGVCWRGGVGSARPV